MLMTLASTFTDRTFLIRPTGDCAPRRDILNVWPLFPPISVPSHDPLDEKRKLFDSTINGPSIETVNPDDSAFNTDQGLSRFHYLRFTLSHPPEFFFWKNHLLPKTADWIAATLTPPEPNGGQLKRKCLLFFWVFLLFFKQKGSGSALVCWRIEETHFPRTWTSP